MITVIGDVIFKSGEKMVIKVIQPLQEDYAERLCRFLGSWLVRNVTAFRSVEKRLYGKYIDYCIDRYFVGEIDNQIVGQAWYGLPKERTGIGNFGNVYTEPSYRRKGIATELVRVLVEDFLQKDGKCLLCDAGQIPGKVYEGFGFKFIQDGAGPMALIKKEVASNFQELDRWYFEAGLDVRVREGNIGDRHDCDRMLDFSRGINEIKDSWHKTFIASQVPTFHDALFYVEDGKGIVTVIESSKRSILGYAFVLNLGSELECNFKILDFIIHPDYFDKAGYFIKETGRIANLAGVTEIYSFSPTCDEEKVSALQKAGFRKEYKFTNKFKIDKECFDIVVFKLRL